MLTKKCTKCGVEKPLDAFFKASNNKYGRYSICKECCSLRNNPLWRIEHRERAELLKRGFKVCNKCKKEKSISEFGIDKKRSDGLKWACRDCERVRSREFARTPEQKAKKKERESQPGFLEHLSEYRKDSIKYKETLIKYRETSPVFKEYQAEYRKRLYVKVRRDLSTRVWAELKLYGKTKQSSYDEYLGCTIEFFFDYMEAKFTEGMSWDNWGRGSDKWHADHIISCAEFDMENEEAIKKCFHYSNYQPLWETDNLRKSSKNSEGKRIFKKYKK